MKFSNALIIISLLVLMVALAVPAHAQYREYYIYGKVVDTEKQPLHNVKITLRDVATSRSYGTKTNKKGEFKLAGLPHGVYSVHMTKEGYRDRTDEWRFTTPQTRMQKVDVKTSTMVSELKLNQIKRSKKLEGFFSEAREKVRKRDFDGAQAILDKLLAEEPNDSNAIYLMGLCHLSKQKLSEAIAQFKRVAELTPDFAGAYYQLGIALQKNGQKEDALTSYQKALKLDPNNLVSLFNSGLILYQLNRAAEAVDYFKKALELKPGAPESLEMVGICYVKMQKYEDALDYLVKAANAATDPEKTKSISELVKDLKTQLGKN